MRKIAVIAAFAVFGAISPASADVQLSLQNGRVTILAKDATVRQILTEWARVGQTKIVNVERIPGTPLTIELRDVPEQQALKILLRSISGYMAAPRTTMAAANASVFDRIVVMPTLAAAAAPLGATPPPAATPLTFSQTLPPPDDRDDLGPNPAAPVPQPPGNRGPVFVFPQPQVIGTPTPAGQANPPQGAPPIFFPQQPPAAPTTPATTSFPGASTTSSPAGVAVPGMPAGVSVPGMIVPAPAPQPGQQPTPQQ
jgi:hypothetical protein